MKDRNEAHPYILTIIVLGLFGGISTIIWLGCLTFISIPTLLVMGLLAGSLALGLHFLLMRRQKRYLAELLIFSFAGWGPIIIALLLSINYFFHGPEKTLYYHFSRGNAMDLNLTPLPVTIPIQDERFRTYPYMLSFSESEIKNKDKLVTEAWFIIAKGSLGYEIVIRKELH